MKHSRPLLIIAPTLFLTRETALAHGIDPVLASNFRAIHRPAMLRGWSQGTPFIAPRMDGWRDFPNGPQLDALMTARIRDGMLRLAQPEDIAACQPERSTS